jgi:periplasmic protein TonB
METKALVLRHWDDVVFENRNKEYGAYPMRKEYSKRLTIGLGISVSVMAILILLADFISNVETDPIIPHIIVCNLGQPPIVVENKKPLLEQVKSRQKNNRITNRPTVTMQPVAEPVETRVEEPTLPGDNRGVEYSQPGPSTTITETPVIAPPQIVDIAEVMPAYTGGIEAMMQYFQRNLKYPASARRMGIEGTVYVQFVVNGDGTVSAVNVIRGIHPDCDKEAARVISKMPAWKGGRQGQMPVGVRMVLPIKFKLN